MALSTVIHQAVLSEDSEATELRPLRLLLLSYAITGPVL